MSFKLFIFFLAIICCRSFCFSQQNDSTYLYLNNTFPIESLKSTLNKENQKKKKNLLGLIYYIRQGNNDSAYYHLKALEKTKNFEPFELVRLKFMKGIYYKITDNDSLKFYNFQSAYTKSILINDTITILRSLEQLSQTYDYNENNSYNKEFLDLYEKKSHVYNLEEHKIKSNFLYANYYLFRDKNQNAIAFYNKALKHEFSAEDSLLIPAIYNNIGSLYSENLNKPDSAIYYFNKQYDILKRYKKNSNPLSFFYNALNTGSAYNKLGDFHKAISFYERADSIELSVNYLSNKSYIKENLANVNFEAKNYKKAFEYLNQYLNLYDSLNKVEQRIAIAKIKEQYDNEKLRADNLESESKRKQNQNLLIGALVFILFGSITVFLLQKNTRKKQKIAEQEKAIETQKLASVLKEQELLSIDAMIEGQEKERQRIANDLHDDLGGLMATVKLHFNALKDKQSSELFDKTNTLLDEAYHKVRTIAHTKNSGVIAKQGLLKAVQNMANKISISNKITVEVLDHGLENRLENSLELTIFRIIQELITNVIKHAEATEATIHLTNHEDTLNIMIEDNGKGFNPSQVTTKNKGMGISSIDKRVEHLNGNMTIESEPNKGTNIIIDIPI